MLIPLKLLFILGLISSPIVASSNATPEPQKIADNQVNMGYSAIRYLLEDEEHLTTIRITKSILSFGGISEPSKKLIDDIADASEKALEELEQLSAHQPAIMFTDFSDDAIGVATLDSLRMTTAKEFLLNNDDFEKRLLVSQAQVLRVISHLAIELAEEELSQKRKRWLNQLSEQYEKFYALVYKRIHVVSS